MVIISNPSTQEKQVEVHVLDVYTMGGQRYAVVEAAEGRPFVGGTHYPVRTKFTTVQESTLVQSAGAVGVTRGA